jgi:hypothetical protein
MQCSPWVALDSALASEHLELMRRLVTQAEAWAIDLGPDLFENPNILSTVLT